MLQIITETGEIEKSDKTPAYEFFQNINNTATHTIYSFGAKSEALKIYEMTFKLISQLLRKQKIWYQ